MDTNMSPTVHLGGPTRAIRSRSRALRLGSPRAQEGAVVMRKKIRAAHAAAWLLGGATLAISGRASAAACNTLTNPVYVSGSSAFKPVLQAVANVLGSAVSIVYQSPGSCEGLGFVTGNMPDTDTPVTIVPNAANGACTLPLAGAVVDIGLSDVYAKTCH